MKTEQIFRKIYQELKEQVSNNNDVFLKEYTIPSINYDPDNENIDNKYFASGIVMELDRMMGFFENKIYYSSYKDKYFFSNNEEKTKKRMITEINNDIPKDNTSDEIIVEDDRNKIKIQKGDSITYKDKLFDKVNEKVVKEYNDFIDNLKQLSPNQIIDKAYEKICKEEFVYKLENKNLSETELKAILKSPNFLSECYEEWLGSDGNFNELLEYSMENAIEQLVNDFKQETKEKNKESR